MGAGRSLFSSKGFTAAIRNDQAQFNCIPAPEPQDSSQLCAYEGGVQYSLSCEAANKKSRGLLRIP